MHRQVVLQLNIDLGKIIVHPHVRQRRDIGGRDRADVEGDVIVHGTDRREREGRVHEGVRGHPRLMEILRNRSGDDFNSLDFLHGLFRRRADPLEAVLSIFLPLLLFSLFLNLLDYLLIIFCGICPERALGTVLAGSPGRPGVLAEVVVPVNGNPAEVAHLSTATAGHAVATLRFN